MSDRDQLLAAGTNHEAARIMDSAVHRLQEERGKLEFVLSNLIQERLRLEEIQQKLREGFHCASCDGHSCPDV